MAASGDIIDELLQQLDGPTVDGAVLASADGGDRLTLRVDHVSKLAASVWELELATDRLAGAPIERVRELASELSERVNYLLEPITPIESDTEACVVQMRSTQPDRSGDGAASYYEVLVKTGGSVSLRRYEKPKGALRKPLAMTLTKEVIGKVAADFLAAVG